MKFYQEKGPMDESSQAKKMRLLTIGLMFSGALNIGLIATGLFTKESTAQVAIRPSTLERLQPETSLIRTLSQMEKLTFHELVSYLTNREPVDEGYLKRDLSLASLVAFHHFNVNKALNFTPFQKREISVNDTTKIELFPGLSNEQFEGIIRFAYEEKWPLTSAGLFKILKKWPETKDESLVQAFLVTPEFHALAMLFQKSESPQLVGSLIHLITEGNWEILDQFTKQQAQLFDLSVERRRSLLLSYLALGSKTAAQILLKTDYSFILKRLEDQGIIGMLSLLGEKSAEAERLCLDLLRSPRSDAVRDKAVSNLYLYAGENPPQVIRHQDVIARFDEKIFAQNKQDGNDPQTNSAFQNTRPRQNQSNPTNLQGNEIQREQNNSTIIPLNRNSSDQRLNVPQNQNQQNKKGITPVPPKGPVHSHEALPSDQNLGTHFMPRQHVVKEGESLWKISKIYNVKVDEIVKANQMEKDRLIPGMVLLIPN
jgi:LysM repeat protein